MPVYKWRAPSQILWDNGGYREYETTNSDPKEVLAHFNKLGMGTKKSELQIYTGGAWKFFEKL